jgi:hypothetical protein
MHQTAVDLFNNWSDNLNNIFWLAAKLAQESPTRSIKRKDTQTLLDEASLLYILIKHVHNQLPGHYREGTPSRCEPPTFTR